MWAWLYIVLFCVSFIFVLREWMPTRLSSLRVATTIRSSSGTLMMVCVTEQPNMQNRLVLLINAHPVKPKHVHLSLSAASEHARSDTRQEIRCIRRLGHLLASHTDQFKYTAPEILFTWLALAYPTLVLMLTQVSGASYSN